ncbi:MAG: Cna B-type domain-containing protein, partial [Clostridia bacterium]|nr:Cna B-type domain-containing protein [Clostridia bacterium]
TTSVSGTKTWADDNNRDKVRPASITVNLLANGTKVDSKTVTAADNWAYSFTNLPKNENGTAITYTITEDAVTGYTTEVSGYNVTNTHEIETVSVSGTKTWSDDNDRDKVRPASIIVNLLANGTKVDSKTVTSADGWAYTFTNLPKNENGTAITYTITENAVAGYTTEVSGYNVTNTHEIETTSVSGTKTWADDNNRDRVRPASITVNLLANGTKVDSKTVTAADNWAYSFTNLPKNENGTAITYTITEEAVAGYTTEVSGYNVTNTHEIETTSVSGTKTWADDNNRDKVRPASITVNLLANGTKVDSKTVTAADNWAYTFENLPKNENGVAITYTITEDTVTGYTTEVSGYNVTNTHEIETVDVSGSKTWKDGNNSGGTRPTSITVNLLANGTKVDSKTVTAADNWAYSFTNLPKNENGTAISYTITEDAVTGYTTSVSGYNVTNTINQKTISISGTKTWVDKPGATNVVHPTITINLYKDGDYLKSTTLTNGNTEYIFEELDKYDLSDGHEIVYTVTENDVPNYTATVNGYNITNTFAQDFTGTVNITTNTTTETTVANPLDVVFVVDISGSMIGNKAKSMVTALNTAITTVLKANNENNDNRVGVVTFNHEATNFIPLNHYTNKDTSNGLKQLITINKNGNKLTRTASGLQNQDISLVTSNYVVGGTYTQVGIKAGADMLNSQQDTTYTTTVNGQEVTLQRTPIIILLTDGEPTLYSTNYQNPTVDNRLGDGISNNSSNYYYYTIRTAAYCKDTITNHYYGQNTDKSAIFYTIGFDMDANDKLHNAILNPTRTNVNNLSNSSNGSKEKALYNALVATGTPYGFDYADEMVIGSAANLNLTSILNTMVQQNISNTMSRAITEEESAAKRVDLTDIDTTKSFELKIGSTTYSTLAAAQSAGYVKGNSSAGYYVDLSNVSKGSNITITYNHV